MTDSLTEPSSSAPGSDATYSYRPSLLGAAWQFQLTDEGLVWDAGRRSGRIPYRAIRRVRLSYKPVSMQSQRFITEIWADDTPRLEIVSSSWKSMLEQERKDEAYSAFVHELHRRIALAQAVVKTQARFEHGAQPLRYWPGLVVFAGVGLGLAWLTVRALQADAKSGAIFVGAFLLLFLWQGGNFFRRNRPGVYAADALPEMLMPK